VNDRPVSVTGGLKQRISFASNTPLGTTVGTKKLTVTIFTSPAIAPNHDDVVLVAFDRADDLKPAVYLDGEVDDTEFTFNFNGVITGTQTYRVTVAFKGGGGRADLFFNLAGGQVSVERLVEP
jgi:hypothetical protein